MPLNSLQKEGEAWWPDKLRRWLAAQTISFQKIITGALQSGQVITSSDYVSTTSGWRLAGDGTAEFNELTINNTVTINDNIDMAGGTLFDLGLLDYAGAMDANDDAGTRTFTNTSFLDLDALTGGAGTINAVAVSATTDTRVLVIVSAASISTNGTGTASLGFRISGATTTAASSTQALRTSGVAALLIGASRCMMTTVTAGLNTFELQATVSAGTGTVTSPELIVIPL